MTRKDYRLIAFAIYDGMDWQLLCSKDSDRDLIKQTTGTIASHLARQLGSTNGAFDRERFERACMTGED